MEEALNNETLNENEQVGGDPDLDKQELEQDMEQQIEQRVQERIKAEQMKAYAAGKASSESISPYFLKFVDMTSEETINTSFEELHKAIDESAVSPGVPHFMKSTVNRSCDSLALGESLSKKSISDIIASGRKSGILGDL